MRNQSSKSQNASSKAQKRSSLTFRMNVLFFCIFLLFSALIFRLGYLQIVKGEEYVELLGRKEEVRVNTSVPRGRIFDRYGRILVDNQPENAITYTKMQSIKSEDMLEVARSLAELIEQPTKRVTYRDKLDYWIMLNKDEAYEKVPKEEIDQIRLKDEEMTEKELNTLIDKMVRDRITDEELAELTEEDLEVLAIYREMASGYNLSPQIIKAEDVSDAEFATVSERLSDLPGVNTTTDWKRVRLTPIAVLGRTTLPSKGLPKSKLNYYLARDYSRNDRVGESYFEAAYEELLQGEKAVVKNVTNKKGEVIETITSYPGKPGKDLVSTIDSELQLETEKIVEKYLVQMKASGAARTLDRAFLVMMNPNTGELLSVVGKKYEKDPNTGETYIADFSYGTFTTSYSVGSSIKGATVLAGYNEGVITKNTTLIDEPIFKAPYTKSSIFNRSGRIAMNELTALEKSSNVYMFKIAMAIGGYTYNNGGVGFNLKPGTMDVLRSNFAQYGLGVPTGIDLPGETAGQLPTTIEQISIIDNAIGQFDTYTPMQLVQYISTIANGGYRVQPRMLKEIRNPSENGEILGSLVAEVDTKVLNKVENTQDELDQVKEGMRRVYFGAQGTATKAFGTAPYTAAGKTGTAQTKIKLDGVVYDSINLTHVGFAPLENPEIAYAVVVPTMTTNLSTYTSINNFIARESVDKYFELKEKYKQEGLLDQTGEQLMLPPLTEEMLEETEEEQKINE